MRDSHRGAPSRAPRGSFKPPEASRILVGDCVFNLRSALDHLALGLAQAHTPGMTEKQVASSEFLIFGDAAELVGKQAHINAGEDGGMIGADFSKIVPRGRLCHSRPGNCGTPM